MSNEINKLRDERTKPIAKIFSTIGMIAVMPFTVVGLLYVLHGMILPTAFISIAILVAIVLLTKFLVNFKIKKRTYRNLKPEIILISIYIIIAIITIPFMFHFIDVDFSRKNELVVMGKDKANSIIALKDEYKRTIKNKQRTFKTSVDDNLTEYFRTQQQVYKDSVENLIGKVNEFSEFIDDPDNEDVQTKIKNQIEKSKEDGVERIEANYKLGIIDAKSDIYVENAIRTFVGWKFLKVSQIYYEIDNEYQKVYDAIKEKMPEFEYTQSQVQDMKLDSAKNSFVKASVGKKILITLIIMILYAVVLLEYFTAERHEIILVRPDDKKDKEEIIW